MFGYAAVFGFTAFIMNFQKYIDLVIGLAVRYIPQLLLALLVLMAGLWIINRITLLMGRGMELRGIDVSLRSFLRSLVNIGLKVMLLFSVADMIGIRTTSFVAILGAAGLAIGLALQGSLSNFAGGVLILIFHPYRIGDMITALTQTGVVQEIQIFNTILLTIDGKTIVLPNGAVSNGMIINHTTSGVLTFTIPLDLPANADFGIVRSKLIVLLSADDRISNPVITIAKLTITTMTISIMGNTRPENSVLVQSDLMERMKTWINQELYV